MLLMLTETDLDAPAQLQYEPAGVDLTDAQISWTDAREFPSLREALHWAMTEEPPSGKAAFIRAASGFVLRPAMLEGLWASLTGPSGRP
jgi:hypothetical protein